MPGTNESMGTSDFRNSYKSASVKTKTTKKTFFLTNMPINKNLGAGFGRNKLLPPLLMLITVFSQHLCRHHFSEMTLRRPAEERDQGLFTYYVWFTAIDYHVGSVALLLLASFC